MSAKYQLTFSPESALPDQGPLHPKLKGTARFLVKDPSPAAPTTSECFVQWHISGLYPCARYFFSLPCLDRCVVDADATGHARGLKHLRSSPQSFASLSGGATVQLVKVERSGSKVDFLVGTSKADEAKFDEDIFKPLRKAASQIAFHMRDYPMEPFDDTGAKKNLPDYKHAHQVPKFNPKNHESLSTASTAANSPTKSFSETVGDTSPSSSHHSAGQTLSASVAALLESPNSLAQQRSRICTGGPPRVEQAQRPKTATGYEVGPVEIGHGVEANLDGLVRVASLTKLRGPKMPSEKTVASSRKSAKKERPSDKLLATAK